MVEFALILPFLLLLVLGVMEVGRLMFIFMAVSTASREAARYGSAAGDLGGANARFQDCAGIRSAARRMGALVGIQNANILISYDHGPDSVTPFIPSCPPASLSQVNLGDRVVVQVSAPYQPLLGLVGLPSFPIVSISRRTILKDVHIQGTPVSPSVPSVWFTQETQSHDENEFGTRTIRVQLSGPTTNTVRVPYVVSGTADPATDFEVNPAGVIEIPNGQTYADITITVFPDDLDEDDENVILTMGDPLFANKSTPDVHTAWIIDDDTTTVSFESASQAPLSEAASSTGSAIKLVLSNPSSRDISVPYTIAGGTATQGEDYALTPNPVMIPAGNTESTIFVTIPGDDIDSLDEETETLVVELGIPNNGAQLGAITQHTLNIIDNDEPPRVFFTWETQDIAETGGVMVVQVELSAPSSKEVRVPIDREGTAAPGEDDQLLTALPLVIPAGSTTGVLEFEILEDDLVEEDESIELAIGTPINASLGEPGTHIAWITNTTLPPEVSFASWGQTQSENAPVFPVFLQLSAATNLPVSVPYQVSGTAASGMDYTILPASEVVIPAGGSQAVILITLTDDILDEESETIVFTMGAPVNATPGSISTHTVTLSDNDATNVSFLSEGESWEEAQGNLTILVRLSSPSSSEISIPFAYSGSASSGEDYSPANSPLVVPAGSTSASISIPLLDDALVEDDEGLTLTLGAPANAGLGDPSTYTATILDNDAPDCQISQANELSVDPSAMTVSWAVDNLGAAPLVLSHLYIEWPSQDQAAPHLVEVRYDANTAWKGIFYSSPAMLGSWQLPEGELTLSPSSSGSIALQFSDPLLPGAYKLSLYFYSPTIGANCAPVRKSYTLSSP